MGFSGRQGRKSNDNKSDAKQGWSATRRHGNVLFEAA